MVQSKQSGTVIAGETFGDATLQRIEWLTIVLGGLGAIWAAWRWGWRGGVGLALGAGLSWVNFRWLKGSVRAFGRVAVTQAGSSAAEGKGGGDVQVKVVRVPPSAYLKFFGRFALLLGVVYAILTRSWLPGMPVLAGLFASAAATVGALVYELIAGGVRQAVDGGS